MPDPYDVFDRDKEYQRIKQQLRKRLGKQWEPGKRLPPIKKLAGQLRLGQNNTHRAIRELVAEGLLVSRPGHGTFVVENIGEYETDQNSNTTRKRPLAGKRVGVLHPWTKPDGFLVEAMESAVGAIQSAGGTGTIERHGDQNHLPGTDKFDGIIVINPNGSAIEIPPGQSLVALNTAAYTNIAAETGYDVVSFDCDHAGYLAGKHFEELGCTDVCFLGCPDNDGFAPYDPTSLSRLRGLELGLGQPIREAWRLLCRCYMSIDGAQAANTFLALKEPRPKGICVASDEIAVGFIHGLASHGYRIPNDFQVIGFDGQAFGQNMAGGPLTTIKAPMAEMGKRAGELLGERIANPELPVRRISIAGALARGKTTGAG